MNSDEEQMREVLDNLRNVQQQMKVQDSLKSPRELLSALSTSWSWSTSARKTHVSNNLPQTLIAKTMDTFSLFYYLS